MLRLESVCSIPIQDLLVTRLAFSPDGRRVAIGHKDLTIYDVLSGRALHTFPFEIFVAGIWFSTDGRYLAAVSEDDAHPRAHGLAKVFDTASGGVVWQAATGSVIGTGCFAGDCFLYRDGSRIAAQRFPGGEAGSALELPEWELRQVVAAGDSLMLFGRESQPATCEVEGAALEYRAFKVGTYSYPEGTRGLVRPLPPGSGMALIAPGGKTLALEVIDLASRSHHLSLIDIASGTEGRLRLAPDSLPSFTFSGNGEQFLCANEDPDGSGTLLRLWETDSMKLLGRAGFASHYHAVALHWPTRRVAALGNGRCDVAVIHTE